MLVTQSTDIAELRAMRSSDGQNRKEYRFRAAGNANSQDPRYDFKFKFAGCQHNRSKGM